MYIEYDYDDELFMVEDEKIGRKSKAPKQKQYKKERKKDYRKEKQYKQKSREEADFEQ